MIRSRDLSKLELVLMSFSALLFFSAFWAYLTQYPLRNFIFGLKNELVHTEVGKLLKKTGTVRREILGDSEFRTANLNSPLFDDDIIVTDNDSTATLQLNDGSSVELGPNTMLKLTIEDKFTLGGISRVQNVQVVSGKVKSKTKNKGLVVVKSPKKVAPLEKEEIESITVGETENVTEVETKPVPKAVAKAEPKPVATPTLVAQAPSVVKSAPSPVPLPSVSPTPSAPPSPLPSPIVVPTTNVSFQPKKKSAVALAPGSQLPQKEVTFQWKGIPPETKLEFILKNLTRNKTVAKDYFTASQKQTVRTIDEPGNYEWKLSVDDKTAHPQVIVNSKFKVDPQFEGIKASEPLVNGEKVDEKTNNDKLFKNFDVSLKWTPYPKVDTYTVKLFRNKTDEVPILEKKVKGTELSLDKKDANMGKLYFRVYANLAKGFVVTSDLKDFYFKYLPPNLIYPINRAVFSKKSLKEGDDAVLLTWKSPNFTEGYEVEVATDEKFKSVVIRKKIQDNFLIMKSPRANAYYWRVRSYVGKTFSPNSSANVIRFR